MPRILPDYRDGVIEQIADELATALQRLEARERECAAWALVAKCAIHAGHELHVELQKASARHDRLLEEYRTLRARTMVEAEAA